MYQALYRKYRPKDFESVVGQDALVRTLKNSIVNGTFSHAYIQLMVVLVEIVKIVCIHLKKNVLILLK